MNIMKHALYLKSKGHKGKWSGSISSLSYKEDDYDVYEVADFTKASWTILENNHLEMESLTITVMSSELDDEEEDLIPLISYHIALNKRTYQTSDIFGCRGFLYSIKRPNKHGVMKEIPYFDPMPVQVRLSSGR